MTHFSSCSCYVSLRADSPICVAFQGPAFLYDPEKGNLLVESETVLSSSTGNYGVFRNGKQDNKCSRVWTSFTDNPTAGFAAGECQSILFKVEDADAICDRLFSFTCGKG
jgi:hypothetical protein